MPLLHPEVYEFLEAEGYKYTIRLPANRILQERIGHLLKRPVGRPSITVRRSYASFRYQDARDLACLAKLAATHDMTGPIFWAVCRRRHGRSQRQNADE